jgi:polysaccharide pyruvyl transferase WcaK-like protein
VWPRPSSNAKSGPGVVIVGAFGMTNLGDDAILAAMLAELREALLGARFAVVTLDRAGVPVADDVVPVAFEDRAIRDALDGADLLIVGGGGLLFDFRIRATYEDFFGDRATNFYPHYRAALVAHGRGIPVQLYAVGVGPLVGAVARGLTRTVCDLASAITVRDALSRVELRGLGVPDEKIEVTADPAVRLVSAAVAKRAAVPRVGFVIRNWFPVTAPGTVQLPHGAAYLARYLDRFAAAADHVVARWGGRPVFFAVQNEVDDDRQFAARVIERMAHRGEAEIVESAAEHGALQGLLGGLDLVVSTRLHGLIFAANAGVPGIGINLNTKVRALLCDLGLGELAVSPWDGRVAALPELIDRVLEQKGEYASRLAVGMAAQRRAAARNPAISAALIAARRGRG